MAIAHVVTEVTVGTGNTTSIAFSTPASASAGQLLVAYLAFQNGSATAINVTHTGWTSRASAHDNAVPGIQILVLTKTAAGGAEAFTFTFDVAPAAMRIGVSAYSGADTATPLTSASGAVEATSNTVHTAPTITASTGTQWGLVAMADRTSASGWTPGTGQTERADSGTAGGTSLYVADSAANLTSGTGYTYSATAPAATSTAVMFSALLNEAVTGQTLTFTAVSTTGTVTGASGQAALSDSSDASFVTLNNGQQIDGTLQAIVPPTGSFVVTFRGVRVGTSGSLAVTLRDGTTTLATATVTAVNTTTGAVTATFSSLGGVTAAQWQSGTLVVRAVATVA